MDISFPIEKYPPTATVRVNNIPLPPNVYKECEFTPNTELYLQIPKRGCLEVGIYKPGMTVERVISLEEGGNLPTGERINQMSKISPGDIVRFEISPCKLTIIRIDKEDDPSYMNPMMDDKNRPIPPGWLVQAFIGAPDVGTFLKAGLRTVHALSECLLFAGKKIDDCKTILDFGCGCGRVLRNLPDITSARLIGCDLHENAIEWCNANMEFGEFFIGTEKPPLPIESNSIDFIYAISVLTHLDADHQDLWLEEWNRILIPNGVIVTTYHGEDYIEKRVRKERVDLIKKEWEKNGGLFFISGGWEGLFPDYYQTTYHTTDYVVTHWSKFFKIIKLLKSGEFANPQNAVIMRKQ